MRIATASTLAVVFILATPTRTAAQTLPAPRVGGYVQARGTIVSPTGFSTTLNRARISVDATLPNRFTARMLTEFEAGATARTAGTVSLREATIRWSYAPYAVQAGQFKTPFSREYLILVPLLETLEFSTVVDTLAPKYDLGVQAEWSVPWASATIGAFNGEGQNAGLNRDSTVLAIARATVRPLPQSTVGVNVARYSGDSLRYGADVTLEEFGALVRGEAIGQQKRGRDRDDLGWSVLGAYRVLPWLQLLARQEDFQRPGIGRARRISTTTGGANVELPGGRTRLAANFLSRKTGYPRVKRNTLIVQAQCRF